MLKLSKKMLKNKKRFSTQGQKSELKYSIIADNFKKLLGCWKALYSISIVS